MYIWDLAKWPHFSFDQKLVSKKLAEVRFNQGKLLGKMALIGFNIQSESALENLTMDVLKSSEIEGEKYDPMQVRSSVAKRLGIDIGGAIKSSRAINGVVDMLIDATVNYSDQLTSDKLKDWQKSLFPLELNNISEIIIGNWRDDNHGPMQVRSSVAKRLGIDIGGAIKSSRAINGVVDMLIDATVNYSDQLTSDKLKDWQKSLFPLELNNISEIIIGNWRDDNHGPMQVVSGPVSKEKIHFEAPPANTIDEQMERFIAWYNQEDQNDNMVKAAIAHLWFVTIHPFEDGNGRIARAISDKLIARADESKKRFYSISMQINANRNQYYAILEKTQKGNLDITEWILWFLDCVNAAIASSEAELKLIKTKAHFWENVSQKALNERQIKVLKKLLDNFQGNITSSKWAKLANCSQDTAQRDIAYLIEQGILVKNDASGRSSSYRVIN